LENACEVHGFSYSRCRSPKNGAAPAPAGG
jgi:hypothetical protein